MRPTKTKARAPGKLLMGPDRWLRHGEAVGKKMAELRSRGIDTCDVGVSPSLLACYSEETIWRAFGRAIRDMVPGVYIFDFDRRRVYVYRRKNAADIMTRSEAIAWFGEEAMRTIDAQLAIVEAGK